MSRYLPILMYHHIGEPPGGAKPGLFVPPALFREQLAFLAARGFRAVSADAVLAALAGEPAGLPGRPVLITFDDTEVPNFGAALGILAEFRFPAIGYFIAGRRQSLPGPGDLEDFRRLGFAVGSHCVSHPWMPDLSPEELKREAGDSRKQLEDLVGAPVIHFAYPHGGYGPREVEAVREAGYRTAVSTRRGNRHALSEILCLRRIPMRPDTPTRRLGRFLGRLWHWEHVFKEALGLEHKNRRKAGR